MRLAGFDGRDAGGLGMLRRREGAVAELQLDDVVSFPGYMKMQEVTEFLLGRHLLVAPSKTALNGDME